MSFNIQQKDAINSLEGYVRVIAAAGSGKTSVLTQRYAELVKRGEKPFNILCVTFTNKAANEMKERIEKLVGKLDNCMIQTFHAFCLRVLREHVYKLGYSSKFVILDADDQKSIMKKIYKENNIDYDEISYESAFGIVSGRKINQEDHLLDLVAKNDIIKKLYEKAKEKKIQFDNDGNGNYQEIIKDCIYYGYLYFQQKAEGLDFNDLIVFTVILFKENRDILERWQNKLKYIMVDEFQDASFRQNELVCMLSEKYKNLFVVGDPDQTIYSWRGAKPEILVNFDKDKDAKTIIMNQNYRSTPTILSAANEIISKNKLRVAKDLFTKNPDGAKVYYHHGIDSKDEAFWVVQMIKEALTKYKPKDIAILYRMHFLSRSVEEKLIQAKIPYVIHSGVNFYERKEIKDILAYLRLVNNTADDLALERIINVPSRKIGNKTIEKIRKIADDEEISMWSAISKLDNDKLNQFIFTIANIRIAYEKNKLSIMELTKRILKDTGYQELIDLDLEKERKENVQELLESMKTEESSLDEYLQKIMLLTNTDKKDNKTAVNMMTIHSAKGLEFPIVFVIGMSEGFFPSRKADTEEKEEEERRLAYVAYTRAMKHLILSDSEGRDFSGDYKETSRFVEEIPQKYIKIM